MSTVKVNGTVICEDVNECDSTSSCPQLCLNTKGGYKCMCKMGFIQEAG